MPPAPWMTRPLNFLRRPRGLLVWVPLVLLIQSDIVTLMSVSGRSMSVSKKSTRNDGEKSG